jgi:hypothetical protein
MTERGKNMENVKFDRRRKYYMVLDCETATMPYAENFDGSARQKISIAKPLIYDLGWQIIDRTGKVYAKRNYLISEIFSVPSIFNTAYYASKRPIYLEKLSKNEITLTDWRTATAILENDLQIVESVGAYNSMFDFKKAIPFTELYINMLYSPNYHDWEEMQNRFIDDMVSNTKPESNKTFEPDLFSFRSKKYPLFDIWGLSCEHILNNDDYKQMCIDNSWLSASGKFFKTSAETSYRFFKGDNDFIESHTAIDDAEIESELFAEIIKRTKNKYEMGIIYFPFRILGKVEDFEILQTARKMGII